MRTVGILTGLIACFTAVLPVLTRTQQELHTPWGDPDLQGIWDRRTITPLERPDQFAGRAFLSDDEVVTYEQRARERSDGRPPDDPVTGLTVHAPEDLDFGSTVLTTRQTSLIIDPPDGRIPPLTEEARSRRIAERTAAANRGPADSWEDRSLFERCITRGIPEGMLPGPYNNNIQIVQTPNEVLILNEMIHETRIIPLNRIAQFPAIISQWLGNSHGYWEDSTLVVETRNFSGQVSFRGARENLLLTERFSRFDEDTLAYEFTVTDPTTWTSAWTVSFPMRKSGQPLYEFACHEGNHSLRNILSTARRLNQ
jgi:hypothetical protein